MGGMFSGCWALTSLNVSSFNTANVTNMESMFFGCGILYGAVAYDETKTDVTMANPETGYFTRTLEDGIAAPAAYGMEHDDAVYDLADQRVKRDYRGIIVRKGKKVLTR